MSSGDESVAFQFSNTGEKCALNVEAVIDRQRVGKYMPMTAN